VRGRQYDAEHRNGGQEVLRDAKFPGDRILRRAYAMKLRRRLGYLQWLASPEGPRAAPYLKRFTPSPLLLRTLRLRHAFSKHPARCHDADVFFLVPTPAVKARAIRRHAEVYGLSVLVETGTHRGDTLAVVAGAFDRCITIELSVDLWQQAQSRFQGREGITCLNGDSGVVLPRVTVELEEAALFWLDAHASGGDTASGDRDPILDELNAVYARRDPRDVILIDDARGHPTDLIARGVPDSHQMVVRNDIIRITPIGPR
jgi:hypothetical protein